MLTEEQMRAAMALPDMPDEEVGRIMRQISDRVYGKAEKQFPQSGDNFRTVPRSQIMAMAGQLDSALNLPERKETDFETHADHMNYLSGRRPVNQ